MKTRGTRSMKKDCCSLVHGGKAITFGFGSAKHSSPIEWYVQIGENVPGAPAKVEPIVIEARGRLW